MKLMSFYGRFQPWAHVGKFEAMSKFHNHDGRESLYIFGLFQLLKMYVLINFKLVKQWVKFFIW
jgi:hypothetical protein